MSKVTKNRFLYVLGVLALIAFAMWLRYASRHIFHSPAVNHLRSGIYVFLFSAWCYSLWIRIVQTQVRRYLLAISVLMVLWILLRSIKFSIENTEAERWLWYFYYFPMLFIPMLSVFVSRSLGKGEDFRIPRWTKILYFPTLLLLLLVLTNDLHQQVFSFPSGVLSDQEYRYEGGYFFVLGWVALCAGFALLSMVKNCRIPRSRRVRWLPLVPLALSLVYACMYIKKVYWVWVLAGDMTVSQCLIFASIFECCIQCGLIQSNLGYDELFEATSLPVQITDSAFCSQYVSVAMQGTLPQSELRQMQQDTVHLGDDTLLKRHKLRRGWVFWKEDISALNQIRKALELTRDELRDTGDVLAVENAQRARWLKLTEENRLYDMMEAQTAPQIAMLRELLTKPMQLAVDPPRKLPKGAVEKHRYATAIPIGTAIAQSLSIPFPETCGDIVGDELERFGVHLWLAPALNIHRNLLCGRNFEYYSEDPLVSGLTAAAVTRGVQKHPGRGVTVKHFAANNQEYNRVNTNSLISQRALREIYLRGFGLCIRESQPAAVMTSYNLINGVHTSESRELTQDVLRCEFGFQGIVMTDWVVEGPGMYNSRRFPRPDPGNVAMAGGDLFMPGSKADYDRLLKKLRAGKLTRQQLERNATRMLRFCKRLAGK